MEILLDFVYTETVHVTVENVQELLPAACLLQLKGTDDKVAIAHATVALEMFRINQVNLITEIMETDCGRSCLPPAAQKIRFQSQRQRTSPYVAIWLFRRAFTPFLFLKK